MAQRHSWCSCAQAVVLALLLLLQPVRGAYRGQPDQRITCDGPMVEAHALGLPATIGKYTARELCEAPSGESTNLPYTTIGAYCERDTLFPTIAFTGDMPVRGNTNVDMYYYFCLRRCRCHDLTTQDRSIPAEAAAVPVYKLNPPTASRWVDADPNDLTGIPISVPFENIPDPSREQNSRLIAPPLRFIEIKSPQTWERPFCNAAIPRNLALPPPFDNPQTRNRIFGNSLQKLCAAEFFGGAKEGNMGFTCQQYNNRWKRLKGEFRLWHLAIPAEVPAASSYYPRERIHASAICRAYCGCYKQEGNHRAKHPRTLVRVFAEDRGQQPFARVERDSVFGMREIEHWIERQGFRAMEESFEGLNREARQHPTRGRGGRQGMGRAASNLDEASRRTAMTAQALRVIEEGVGLNRDRNH